MLRDLLEATPFLAPMGAGVALLWILGRDRDRTADQHDLSDYHDETPEQAELRRRWVAGYNRDRYRTRILPPDRPADVLPPVPADQNIGVPLYAAIVVDQVARRCGTDPADRAARFLREIAAEAGDVVWTSTADRDLTGAFPVVAVAQ